MWHGSLRMSHVVAATFGDDSVRVRLSLSLPWTLSMSLSLSFFGRGVMASSGVTSQDSMPWVTLSQAKKKL